MASNKFATILHRNTHRITVILVYTFLEWILIIFLLLNSFFSYLIIKFANYFGLKSPCIWCSRVDHVLEPGKDVNSYRDLVCETHAMEISKLGYCSNHRKLASARNMCEDCSSSPRPDGRIAFVSLVKDMGMVSGDGRLKVENSEKDSTTCSCCGVSLEGGFYSPYLFLKPSWDVLDYTHKGNLIEVGENCNGFNDYGCSDPSKSNCLTDHDEDEIGNRDGVVENKMIADVFDDEGVEGPTSEECSRSLPSFHCESMEGEDEPVQDDSKMSLGGTTAAAFQNSDDNEIDQIRKCPEEDASIEIFSPRLENCFGDDDDHRLVPVELIDSMTVDDQNSSKLLEFQICCLLDIESKFQEQAGPIVDTESVMEEGKPVFSINENEDDAGSEGTKPEVMKEEIRNEIRSSLVFITEDSDGDLVAELCDRVSGTQATQITPSNGDNVEPVAIFVKDSDAHSASKEDNKMIDIGAETENLIGTEICNQETVDPCQVQENSILISACLDDFSSTNYDDTEICHQETVDSDRVHEQSFRSLASPDDDLSSKNYEDTKNSTSGEEFVADHDQETNQEREPLTVEDCSLERNKEPGIESVERNGEAITHHLSICSEINEAEEEKAPETPTYIEGIPSPHKRLMYERKELGTESLDGSVISEVDGGEVLTVDRLKTALKAERRALSALYTELDEERSASAIAANQTMAMITRLQEEKSAMQMEALQYQRMMEEQSEYDQEALQLLNELMVKREKEKQELEKELELYRKKVFLYEAKQKRSMKKRKANGLNGISSTSSSAEDSDEVSIDLNEVEDSFYSTQESIQSVQNTPADAVSGSVMAQESEKHLSTLDESLADFEEERLSILEQLKALEEKLFTLGDEEECFEDIKPIEDFAVENGEEVDENYGLCSPDVNGDMNGFSDDLGMSRQNYQDRGNKGYRAKTLLPLFDAISMENEDEFPGEQENSAITQNSVSKFESQNKKFAIEEEVDHVYERLQALEADRDFLKHCVSSLKKGDKGMDLLQEILQHLRNLRTVDLRVKNTSESLV